MFWFVSEGMPVCMKNTSIGNLKIQTIIDSGFLVHGETRYSKAHRHLNHELYFVESGTVDIWCEGTTWSCTANDLFFSPAGHSHNIKHLSNDASLYSFRFSISQTGSFEEQLSAPHELIFSSLQHVRLFRNKPESLMQIQKIRTALYQKDLFFTDKMDGLLKIFYTDLFHDFLDIPEKKPPVHFSISFDLQHPGLSEFYRSDIPQEYYIDLMDEYFTHCYRQSTSLQDLANQLHLSVSQTQRMIKNHYGVSFREKLIQTRIDAAKRFLRDTALSLETIAEQVGYHSYNGFFETFYSKVGKTPSEYRHQTTDDSSEI